MNNSAIVLLINDDARAIRATYEDNATPALFKTMDPSIEVDDLVVVETSTRHGMTVVKVTEVDIDIDFDADAPIKWVIEKIDAKAFDKLIEQEKKAIAAVHSAERRRKKEALKASLFADQRDKIDALELSHTVVDED